MTKKTIPFTKMHGAGNDFVLIDHNQTSMKVTPKTAALLLDRHFGIGGDQLLELNAGKNGTPELRIYNSDGSVAEMCGNGVRAVAYHLIKNQRYRENFRIKTKAGIIGISSVGGHIEVDMGRPILEGRKIPVAASGEIMGRPLTVDGRKFLIHAVSMGNPHCVIFVKDVAGIALERIGPQIEHHKFFPRRVNVEFVQVMNRHQVKARIWERGAGMTLACGTGACAIAVAAARAGLTARQVSIDVPGGRLAVRWGDNGHVFLGGPAEVTYSGKFFL